MADIEKESQTPSDPWLAYHDVLFRLYVKERKTLRQVRSIMMASPYNLQATEKEYERGLKRLGFSKKLKRNDWPIIDQQIRKRKRDGKGSEVFLCEELIPAKKVRKEILRNKTGNTQFVPDVHTLPEGVAVRTPLTSPVMAPSAAVILRENWGMETSSISENARHLPRSYPTVASNMFLRRPWSPPPSGSAISVTAQLETIADTPQPFQIGAYQARLLKDVPSIRFRNLFVSSSLFQTVFLPALASLPDATLRHLHSGALARLRLICDKTALGLQSSGCMSISTEFARTTQPPEDHDDAESQAKTLLGEIAACFASGKHFDQDRALELLEQAMDQRFTRLFELFFQSNDITTKQLSTELVRKSVSEVCRDGNEAHRLRFLVDTGIGKSHLTGIEGGFFLNLALKNRAYEAATILLQEKAQIGNIHLIYRIVETIRNKGVVRGLLDNGALRSPEDKNLILQKFVEEGDIEGVQLMLGAGADVDEIESPETTYSYEVWAVDWAHFMGMSEIYSMLLPHSRRARHFLTISGVFDAAGISLTHLKGYLEKKSEDPIHPRAAVLRSALCRAVTEGDHSRAENILLLGVDPGDRPDFPYEHETLLTVAMSHGNSGMIALLRRFGAKITKDCLVTAITKPDFGVVRDILSLQPELVEEIPDAIIKALQHFPASVIDYELSEDTYMDDDTDGESNGDTDDDLYDDEPYIIILRSLIRAGADPNQCETAFPRSYPLHRARSHYRILRYLIAEGADVNMIDHDGYTPLHRLLEDGAGVRSAKVLISAGTRLEEPLRFGIRSLLETAAEKKWDPVIFRLLLDAGASVNRSPRDDDYAVYNSALALAIRNEAGQHIVQMALEAGADVNHPGSKSFNDGRTPLQAAVEKGNETLVEELLRRGANVNLPPAHYYGRTALQIAAGQGNLKLMKLLFQRGADVNAPPAEIYGRTALQAACCSVKYSSCAGDRLHAVKLLLSQGADIHAVAGPCAGVTALQGAAITGDMELVLFLLEAGADVNASRSRRYGRTALDGAAEHGRLDVVQVLLNAGAIGDMANGEIYGRAIELAEDEGYFVVAEYLRERAANPLPYNNFPTFDAYNNFPTFDAHFGGWEEPGGFPEWIP